MDNMSTDCKVLEMLFWEFLFGDADGVHLASGVATQVVNARRLHLAGFLQHFGGGFETVT